MIDSDLKYTKNFFNLEENIDKIIDVFDKYEFYDVMRAVYCINLYIHNRSALTTQMRLNLALILCKKTGTLKIDNYKEFRNFFKEIKIYTNIGIFDDPILEDFGEIKFKYNSKTYRTIVGTGYNAVYAQLHFLEPLANITKMESAVEKVIKYNSDNINYFKEVNISSGEERKRFILPPCKLFTKVKKYFKEINFLENKELFKIVDNKTNFIEDKYFILFEDKYFPLYNTAILINLFNILYSDLSEDEKNMVVEKGIYNSLFDLSILDQGDNRQIYYPVKLHNKMSDLNVNPYSFLGFTSRGNTIIAINKSRYSSDNELNNDIECLINFYTKNQLKLVELRRNNSKGFLELTISSKSKLKFIIYDNYVNLYEPNAILGEKRKSNALECNALDLIYLLTFSDGLDEIEDYIDYNDQNEFDQMIGYGGDSSRFFTWKSMNHMIAKGAIKFGMINMDINTTDGYVLDYFRNIINDFPWECSNKFLFEKPFSWIIEKRSNDILFFRNKIVPTFAGIVKYFSNSQLCFFAQNLLFWDKSNIVQFDGISTLLDDLITRKLKTCYKFFNNISISSKKSIYFLCLPLEYAKKVGLNINDGTDIVYSDFIEDEYTISIRYTINYDLLCKKIKDASNRQIENDFIKKLMEPLSKKYFDEINELNEYLTKTNCDKKEVDVFQIELDYMYNVSYRKYKVDDYSYLSAKKLIAKVCMDNQISPGEYYSRDATSLIRKMQKELINQFENIILNYNLLDLHTKLIEMYANATHEIFVHRNRYNLINDVDENIINEIRSNIVEQREEAKQESRTLLYLIESNLYLQREVDKKINDKDLKFLLAFSHWLVNLNDTADICYFTENEAHIEVSFEYVVDNIGDNIENENDNYIRRVYLSNNYSIQYDETDTLYFNNVISTFNEETGYDLSTIVDICYFLQTEFLNYDYEKLDENVYRISEESFIDNLYSLVVNKVRDIYPKDSIKKNLDLLIICPEKLKDWKGKRQEFLPFNEREKRDNRFEIKPLIREDNDIIFSPPLIKNVNNLWFEGIFNFMLPYEIGIPKTRDCILEWKKRYEDKMVYDIKDIFIDNNISFVKINVELHRVDRNEHYPIDIGDYDVIAIDDVKKNIWIIESKYLNRVGNFYEMFDQQRNFFKENKYIEKFQRRIDFMNNNYKRVLKSFGFVDVSGYNVLSYMVFNKVMISRYRKIDIPLISISELSGIINTTN